MNNLKFMIPFLKVILGIAITITVLVIAIIILAIMAKEPLARIAFSLITAIITPWCAYFLLKNAIRIKLLREKNNWN